MCLTLKISNDNFILVLYILIRSLLTAITQNVRHVNTKVYFYKKNNLLKYVYKWQLGPEKKFKKILRNMFIPSQLFK